MFQLVRIIVDSLTQTQICSCGEAKNMENEEMVLTLASYLRPLESKENLLLSHAEGSILLRSLKSIKYTHGDVMNTDNLVSGRIVLVILLFQTQCFILKKELL